jgi:integrase
MRVYHSALAPFIQSLILEKQALGYRYESEDYILELFDKFVAETPYNDGTISHDLIMEWSKQKETEGKSRRNQRMSTIRQLAKHMISLGIDCYLPDRMDSVWTPDPYILSKLELHNFFQSVDKYELKFNYSTPITCSYSVLFRLYYCCGLRLSEGSELRRKDFDLDRGVITVIQSKGDKDRLVYVAEGVLSLCRNYDALMEIILPAREWFFPGRNPDKPISNTTVHRAFNFCWINSEKCINTANSGKKPTVHSLRHTYVVDTINKWQNEGLDVSNLMAYLSRQLGHKSPVGTQYYFHTTVAAIPMIRKIDSKSDQLIPPFKEDIIETEDLISDKNCVKPIDGKKNKSNNHKVIRSPKSAERIFSGVK